MDAFAAAAWYAVTVAAVRLAWGVARRLFPRDTPAQRAMHMLTLLWVSLVAVSSILGSIGALNAVALAAGLLIAAMALFWLSMRIGDPAQHTAAAAPKGPAQPGHITAWPWEAFWIGTAAFAGALVVVRAVLQFPRDWDTLMYHRPLIDHWLQSSSLYVPACAVWHVPGNNELMGLWWAAPFSGDFWVALMNLPAVLLLALAVFELGGLIGLTPILRHSMVIAALASSVVFRQLVDAKNDVAVAGLFTAGVAYGLRYVQARQRSDLALSGLALGLLAGVKYYALGYAAVAWLGLSATCWLHRGRRAALALALTAGALMLLAGGYWYARNSVVTGTPIYPVGYSGENASEAKMSVSVWRSSLLGNGRLELWPQYVAAVWNMAGPCQVVALLAFPLSAAWLPAGALLSSTRRERRFGVAVRGGLAVLLLGALVVFAITPFTVDPDQDRLISSEYIVVRFSQVLLVLLLFTLALLLSDVSRWVRGAAEDGLARRVASAVLPIVFAGAALISLILHATESAEADVSLVVLVTFNFVLSGLLLRELALFGTRTRRHILTAAVVGGLAIFVVTTISLSRWWHDNFAAHYDQRNRTGTFSLLEQWEGAPPGIATTEPRYYPFFGSRRQIEVWRPRRIATEADFFAYLAPREIDLIAVPRVATFKFDVDRYSAVRRGVDEYPHIFERLARGSWIDLYRIRRDRLKAQVSTASVEGPAPDNGQ